MKKYLLTLSLFNLGLVTVLLSPSLFAVELVGHTKSKNPLDVVAEISGKINMADIQTGDKVIKGETLAKVKAQDYKLIVGKQAANLDLAKADLKIKQSQYERYQELRDKNSLSKNELDIAAADYDSAKANFSRAQIDLRKAKLDLENTQVYTTINGYVVSRSVENGAWVNQGDLLYQIVNIDTLTIRFLASEFDLHELKIGQDIELWSEAKPGLKVHSTIKRIGVEIDPASFAYPVEVEISNAQHLFKPGMTIHASTSYLSLAGSK